MDLGLSGKIAIVTGGAKGIGAGVCRCLVQEGATVVVNTHSNDEMSQAFCAELAEVGNVLAIQGDVSKEDDVSAIFKSAVDAFGRIDILVNNAGVTDGYPIDKMTLAQWRRVVDTNLTGTFLMCREMVRLCRKTKKGGAIVNILSKAAVSSTTKGRTAYNASKAGGLGFTKALAGEVIGDGIRVNGVLPGFVRNSRTDKLFETDFEAMEIKRKRLPTQQFGMPEDIGVMVAMLASEKCKLAIGSIVDMTGGLLL